MPLTLSLTEGLLPEESHAVAIARLTESFLKWHGLADNALMRANVVAHLHILPRNTTFAGGQPTPLALVEWRVPAFAFTDRDAQRGHLAEATDIIHALSGGACPREQVFGSVIHAVDGTWNLNGVAMSNAELGAALAA